MRIVSLLPGATEIVAALGFGEQLLGRSHECDYPHWVASLPVCSRPRIDIEAPGAVLDRSVRDLVARGLSIYEIDAERLLELAPDVIVTQTQCEVCAVSERDVVDAVSSWLGKRPQIVSLTPNTLSDIYADIHRVAGALGDEAAGRGVAGALDRALRTIAAEAARLEEIPRLACIEWVDPLMAAGNWMPELVEITGGRNVLGGTGEHSPSITMETLEGARPDVVLIAPCGLSIDRTREELPALVCDERWSRLPAVRAARVYLADGHQYFNRPGPRLAESAEILAEILHPGRFDYGHEGQGWARL